MVRQKHTGILASMERQVLQTIMANIMALIVVLGGGFLLYITRGDTNAHDLQLIVAGFIGSALTWSFGSETSTRTANATAKTYAAGVAVPNVPPTEPQPHQPLADETLRG